MYALICYGRQRNLMIYQNKLLMLKILFCGARRLGMDCLKELIRYPNISIKGIVIPEDRKNKWWTDIDEREFLTKMKERSISWEKAKKIKDLDLVFSVLHGPIFRENFIRKVNYGVINLHPAPLPEYRGRNGVAHAIINGEYKFGAAIHYVDSGIDTGPIIGQKIIRINPHDTGYRLYQKTHRAAFKLFKDTLPLIINSALKGKMLSSKPQDEAKARYFNRTSIQNKEVDLRWPYKKVYNFVRALQFKPFEPAYFMHQGKKIHLMVKGGRLVVSRY